jgi:uncharacterized protein YjaZ
MQPLLRFFSIQTQLQEVQLKEKQLETIVEMGKNTQSHGSFSEDDRKSIKQDIVLLEDSFSALKVKMGEKLKR